MLIIQCILTNMDCPVHLHGGCVLVMRAIGFSVTRAQRQRLWDVPTLVQAAATNSIDGNHIHTDMVVCPCRPRGRPPGSKNRKTLLKEAGLLTDDPNSMEALENHPLLAPPPAKKRGRPPGSKNKKTLEAIQLKAEGTELQPVIQPVDPIPEEAVTVAAAASGILEATPSATFLLHAPANSLLCGIQMLRIFVDGASLRLSLLDLSLLTAAHS